MMFEEAGLPHAEPLEKIPNSRLALMLAELARDRGVFDPHSRMRYSRPSWSGSDTRR